MGGSASRRGGLHPGGGVCIQEGGLHPGGGSAQGGLSASSSNFFTV